MSVAGSQKVVGPGPSPPALVSAENGSQILRVGQKRFFLDPGANHRGQFVRITEVRPLGSVFSPILMHNWNSVSEQQKEQENRDWKGSNIVHLVVLIILPLTDRALGVLSVAQALSRLPWSRVLACEGSV